MRGVTFINCPTTTLAQIESSIGGKTAINLAGTKNTVGAFYQPSLVVADPDTLKSLPERHFINGLAAVSYTHLRKNAHIILQRSYAQLCDIAVSS